MRSRTATRATVSSLKSQTLIYSAAIAFASRNDSEERRKAGLQRYMKAVHRRGKAKYELGRYEDALEDFQKAQVSLKCVHPFKSRSEN